MTAIARRATLLLVLGAMLLPAQERAPSPRRTPRKWVLPFVGAALGAVAASAFTLSGGGDDVGSCTKAKCVMSISVAGGAFIGYLIGREQDLLHRVRFGGRMPLHPPTEALRFVGEPVALAVRDGAGAVGGLGGVQAFTAVPRLRTTTTRAAGLRAISAIDISDPAGSLGVLALGGLYRYPAGDGLGSLVRAGEVLSATVLGSTRYVAVGARIEAVPLSADSAHSWPGILLPHRVTAVISDPTRGAVWALVDSSLYRLAPAGDSLAIIGAPVALHAIGRRLSLSGDRLVVALGDAGVAWFDAANGGRAMGRFRDVRFAYDAALWRNRLFVAAGIDGISVVDIGRADGPLLLGVAREIGQAVAVTVSGDYAYVLERSTNTVLRLRPDFPLR
ncbi:MAG: hypothetical protein K2X99_08545 [Gemmatimonadaceae bacterium]|nr:hypothetical protein [Gemmatimonadaceae bacterium]